MSKITEAWFIEHCDEPNCCLGSFDYECPCCGHKETDYDIWWEKDNIYGGKNHEFECGGCKKKLVVSWDKEEWEIIVKKI